MVSSKKGYSYLEPSRLDSFQSALVHRGEKKYLHLTEKQTSACKVISLGFIMLFYLLMLFEASVIFSDWHQIWT